MPAALPDVLTRRQRLSLGIVLAVAFALRLLYLVDAWNSPGYVWEDPDGYAAQALKLSGPDGWRWTFRAVTYTINGQPHALPPGYSVFLSLFALFPGFPATAQVAQVLLGVLAAALVFGIGRQVHTPRAGLIAAAGYAVWVPNIFNAWSTSQELLYIPLILVAFLLFGRSIRRDSRPSAFLIPGIGFGVSALTRSMPLFFVLPAACLHVLLARNRRQASRQAAAFVAGFILVTAPYSAALSRYRGQATIIDTHGSIHVAAPGGGRAPGLVETGRALVADIAAAPAGFAGGVLTRMRSLLHVNGGRILQIYVVAASRARAIAWKAFVHLGSDALLVISAILAALGAVLCRDRRLSSQYLLWTAINIMIAAVGGFGGARLRAPFEPLILVLAAVVCAGSWRRAGPIGVAVASAVGVLAAYAVVPQMPRSLEAWPDYGISWPSVFSRASGQFTGSAGLNVPADNGATAFVVRASGRSSPQLRVRVGGVHVRTVQLAGQEPTPVHAAWPARGLAYVELEVAREAGGSGQEAIHVSVPGR